MKSTSLVEPVFIVGTGRCGSSIFHKMMAEHAQLAFFTPILNRYPYKPALNSVILDKLDNSSIHHFDQSPQFKPSEAWNFWENYAPGFRQPFRDLRATDVMANAKQSLQEVFPSLLTTKRARLLVKLTGWTRIGFIKEVFPDAKIIHIIRDPRAVAASFLQVDWWKGWHGPNQWRWGPLTVEEECIWGKSDQSFLVLAAIQWRKIMVAYRRSLNEIPESFRKDVMEISYEKLCHSPKQVMNDVLSFTHLEKSSGYQTILGNYQLDDKNYKWNQNMTARQKQELNQALEELKWESILQD